MLASQIFGVFDKMLSKCNCLLINIVPHHGWYLNNVSKSEWSTKLIANCIHVANPILKYFLHISGIFDSKTLMISNFIDEITHTCTTSQPHWSTYHKETWQLSTWQLSTSKLKKLLFLIINFSFIFIFYKSTTIDSGIDSVRCATTFNKSELLVIFLLRTSNQI